MSGFSQNCDTHNSKEMRTITAVLKYAIIILIAIVALTAAPCAAATGDYSHFSTEHRDWTAHSLTREGYNCLTRESLDSSKMFFSMAASKYSPSLPRREKKNCAIAMNDLGYIQLFYHQNYESAYIWLQRALQICKQEGFDETLPAILDNMARIYEDYGDKYGALRIYKEAFHRATHCDNWFITIMVFNDMVSMAFHHSLLDSISGEVATFCRLSIPDRPMKHFSLELCRTISLIQQGRHAQAAQVLERAAGSLNAEVDKPQYEINYHRYLASTYIAAKDYGKAMENLAEGERISKDNGLNGILANIYEAMAECQAAIRNHTQAKEYRYLALTVRDSIYTAHNFGRIKDFESSARIDSLNREIQIADARRSHGLMITKLLVAAILVAGAFITYIIHKNRELKASNHAIVRRNKEIIAEQTFEANLRKDYEARIYRLEQKIASCVPATASMPAETDTHETQLPTDEDSLHLVARIKDIMQDSPEILSHDFSLARLAEMVGSKSKYVSTAINDALGKNFTTMLAEARMREACRMLSDEKMVRGHTIEAVAESVGYRSRTHFISVFKRIVGITPAKYMNLSREGNCNNKDTNEAHKANQNV